MNDWNHGYVTEIGYTFGYYKELNPLRMHMAFLHAGLVPPSLECACELGFGQGLSLNLHAAASQIAWHGTDFNPAQAGFAKNLANQSQASLNLFDESFAQLAARKDLPEFDFIGLHGIWSWVSDENKRHIVEIIKNQLKVGGVVYISYNTLPGWSAFTPLRHLMTQHDQMMHSSGMAMNKRIKESLDFTEKFLDSNPAYARHNGTTVKDRFNNIKAHDARYLAHEYFNRDWDPMYFSDMADYLSDAKLEFACSAHFIDHIDNLNMTPEQAQMLASVENEHHRETLRDFIVNQQFRKDYWVKGKRRMDRIGQFETIRQLRVILMVDQSQVPNKIKAGQGEITLNPNLAPIAQVLGDRQPHSIADIEQALEKMGKAIPLLNLFQALAIYTGAGMVEPVQTPEMVEASTPTAQRLNHHLLHLARSSAELTQLASPLTGGGVQVNRFTQLFILAEVMGHRTPTAMAQFAWQTLSSLGQRCVRDGKTLETEQENLEELGRINQNFLASQRPFLKTLRVY